MLVAVPMLAACGSDSDDNGGSCDDNAAPTTYRGARQVTCSGTAADPIACCGYLGESCNYTLCRKSQCGEWTEDSWSCV
ncbi:hypothetical protein LZ198_17990 [Myxococcus sp. K15C18031901]|uniref:hypothetical protein n=1 Tax=Myxococcus dinghuensis TaxID=2906761 RepID=UPI0020A80DA0|nr:hypothetical protein [Myxococcus dinghuensis]MCP3100764.1 hypothetical protein [Myxococcus dinghuensis]